MAPRCASRVTTRASCNARSPAATSRSATASPSRSNSLPPNLPSSELRSTSSSTGSWATPYSTAAVLSSLTRACPRTCTAGRSFSLYGDTTGETDEFGLPIRYPWANDYRGRAAVVYGHTPVPEATWVNGTICIDTGCVFGGKLTALRWPERELVSVPAATTYYEPLKSLAPPRETRAEG